MLRELDTLIGSNIDSVIVIDDIRCMETLGYPSPKEILDRILEGKSVTVRYDQFIIV